MGNELNLQMGNRIRQRREAMKYSREELSEMVGISLRFLTDIELGTKGMSFSTLIRICSVLNTSTDFIILGKKENDVFSDFRETLENIDEKYLPLLSEIFNLFVKTIKYSDNK